MDNDFSDDVGIDLTPLIDVVFMLLIFFIMTTTFSKPVLDIILPRSEAAENPSAKSKELQIGIKADGTIHHDGKPVSTDELPAILDSMPEALLDLHVDEKAPFEAFVKVVDIAKEKRGGRFVISTQTPYAD